MSTELFSTGRPGGDPLIHREETAHRPRGRTRVIVGVVLAVIGLAGIALGSIGVAIVQHRDGDGFYSTAGRHLETDGYAVVGVAESDSVSVPVVSASSILDRIRITGTSRSGTDLFIGIGPADDVTRYLGGVAHGEVTDLDGQVTPASTDRAGHAPATPPTVQRFWTASGTAAGHVQVRSEIPGQDWAVVVMNADGSPHVSADVSVGASFPIVVTATWTSYLAGALALAAGAVCLVSASRTARNAGRVRS